MENWKIKKIKYFFLRDINDNNKNIIWIQYRKKGYYATFLSNGLR
jgi:hypothetical protein